MDINFVGGLDEEDSAAEKVEKRTRELGEEHPDTISAVNQLACLFLKQGKLDEALAMFQDVSAKRKRSLGDEHPDTIGASNNIAITLGAQGKPIEAAKMLEGILRIEKCALGEEHESTLKTMSNIAAMLGVGGELEKAIALLQEVKEKMIRTEHKNTISTICNIAGLLHKQGKLEEAVVTFAEALEIQKRVLGEEHQDTVSTMKTLVSISLKQENMDEAAAMLTRILDVQKHVYGDDHPDTVSTMKTLVSISLKQENLDEATAMLTRMLDVQKHVYGDDHPDTVSTMETLVSNFLKQENLDEAGAMLTRMLDVQKHVYGDDHPDTVSTMQKFAFVFMRQGKLDEAMVILTEVLEIRRRVFSYDHPDTISAVSDIAAALGAQGRLDEAAAMFAEALEGRKRVSPDEHENIFLNMANLAAVLEAGKKWDEAIPVRKDVLEKSKSIFGNEHPRTIHAMDKLAEALRHKGRLEESLAMKKRVMEKYRIRGNKDASEDEASEDERRGLFSIPLKSGESLGEVAAPSQESKETGGIDDAQELASVASSAAPVDVGQDSVCDTSASMNNPEESFVAEHGDLGDVRLHVYLGKDRTVNLVRVQVGDRYLDELNLNRPIDDGVRDFVKDAWTYEVDNSFALSLFASLDTSTLLTSLPVSSQPCERCTKMKLLSDGFDLIFSMSELQDTSTTSCELCNMFHQCLRQLDVSWSNPVRVYRHASTLKVDDYDKPILRICADPGSRDRVPEDIQIGFPVLPEIGSPIHLELIRRWLKICDTEHDCRSQSNPQLPTRVLDVGDDRHSNSLQLYCTQPEERGRYIILSHCWGKLDKKEREKFCTYACNVAKRCRGIRWDDLPRTFQDAVTITKVLGVRFLWIDSICIIQPHKECSKACDTLSDWDAESKNMEEYYGSAYCTIAATSARDSTKGFLLPRSVRRCVRVPDDSDCTLYICDDIDDFHSDVEEGILNQRGWVLQERALSCRTIHFATNRVYWECGQGVHCESMTRASNPRTGFLGDPKFPSLILEHSVGNRLRLLESLFTMYSRLKLTESTDRPIAISGLQKRLAKTLETEVQSGILKLYFHRNLLWQRSDRSALRRIAFPVGRRVPSWSWMAYDGEISFLAVPFGQTEWSNTLKFELSEPGCLQQHPTSPPVALRGLARELSLSEDEVRLLSFDEHGASDIRGLRCVVVGRGDTNKGTEEQVHYVLVVEPLREEVDTYHRVGVGCIQRRQISFKESPILIRVI